MTDKLIFVILLSILSGGIWSCSQKEGCTRSSAINFDKDAEKDNGSCIDFIDLDQNLVDITNVQYPKIHSGVFITNQDGGPVDTFRVVHGGKGKISADSTVRVFYTNFDIDSRNAKPGDVIIKKVYRKNFQTGLQDTSKLLGVTAMFKQNQGYWPEGGDWEYIVIPSTSITSKNPNGVLPPTTEITKRGKLKSCGECHKSGGSDYVLFK